MLLKLAQRNIFRNRRRTFLTVSMMVCGYVLVSLFIAWADGAYGEIISQFINARTGEAQIHFKDYLEEPKMYKAIADYEGLLSHLESNPSVLSMSPRVKGGALIFLNTKNFHANVVGIDFDKEIAATNFLRRIPIDSGSIGKNSYVIVLGEKVANALKAVVGDEVMLLSSGADGSIANDLFKVIDIARGDRAKIDEMNVYIPINVAQEFFSLPGKVHEIMLRTKGKLADLNLPTDLTLSGWKEIEKDFYKAMEADRKGDNVARFIIMVLVALGVFNTVLMSVMERMREFGVLKAIGTNPSFLFKMIVLENIIVGALSIVIGTILALAVNYYFSKHGITFGETFEYGGFEFNEMKAVMELRSYILPSIVILVTSIFVSLYPAYRAAKIPAIEAIHS